MFFSGADTNPNEASMEPEIARGSYDAELMRREFSISSPFEDESVFDQAIANVALALEACSCRTTGTDKPPLQAPAKEEEGPSSASLYESDTFASEFARLQALQSCQVLNTAPEHRFDAITTLLAGLFDVPVAIVTLVASNTVWFKSSFGPFQGCVMREGSFCSYISVPDYAEMLVVEDCLLDARFVGNPYVAGPPHLRFYAACPLVTAAGQRLGTLCICDFRPRRLPATAYNLMCNLGELVAREVEAGLTSRQLSVDRAGSFSLEESANNSTGEGCACAPPPAQPAAREPVIILNTAEDGWPVVYCNDALKGLLGTGGGALENVSFWDIFTTDDVDADCAALQARVGADARAAVVAHLSGDADRAAYEVQFRCASRARLHNSAPVSIPGFVAPHEAAAEDMPSMLPLDALWIGTVHVLSSGSPERKNSGTISPTYSSRSPFAGGAGPKPHPLATLKLGPLLGQGGHGKVFRSMLKDKAVAVKVMDLVRPAPRPTRISSTSVLSLQELSGSGGPGSNGDTTSSAVVLEAVLSRHLAHPNIVPTLDFVVNYEGDTPTTMWIVQHLCDRGSLYDVLDRGVLREAPSLAAGPCLPAVLETALDIASALEYLHGENILHCDLSAGNVLLSSAANARGFVALVSDFGLSQAFCADSNDQALGTVTHMAPELLMKGVPTKATDVYSFGILLWEMWSGKRAWAGSIPANIIFQVTIERRQLEMPADGPAALRDMAAACMAFDPALRPSFSDIVATLRGLRSA